MIKPIDISPLRTTNKCYYECEVCGQKGTITFTNRLINTDKEGDLEELESEQCPRCNSVLGDKNEKISQQKN